jgi:hypothetical protein
MLYTGFLLPFLSNKRKTLQKDNYEKIKNLFRNCLNIFIFRKDYLSWTVQNQQKVGVQTNGSEQLSPLCYFIAV